MKKVLLILANFQFMEMGGKLNEYVAKHMKKMLENKGYEVTLNQIARGYDVDEEVKKMNEHDIIIFQYPIWWFNTPWGLKKYVDEVFMAAQGTLWANDGRTSKDPSRKYGSGGLTKNKKYMLSVTFNAPKEALDKGQYLEMGLENLLSNMNKALQFLNIQHIPSFACHDVIKNPDVDLYVKELKQHIDKHF